MQTNEANSSMATLRAHAEGRIHHVNAGLCPDMLTGPESRDPDCPVCNALRAQAAERALLSVARKCAQCKKVYRHGPASVGCPKCAPGVQISEHEFQKPLAQPASPPSYVNSAGIVASDMPGTVVRKLVAAYHRATGTTATDAACQAQEGGA